MDLRTQVNAVFRNPGTTWGLNGVALTVCPNSTPRSVHQVNNNCAPSYAGALNALVNGTWAHEDLHLFAGLVSAQQTDHDVDKVWESLVSMSSSDLRNTANQLYTFIHGQVNGDAVRVHNGLPSHTDTFYAPDLAGAWGLFAFTVRYL